MSGPTVPDETPEVKLLTMQELRERVAAAIEGGPDAILDVAAEVLDGPMAPSVCAVIAAAIRKLKGRVVPPLPEGGSIAGVTLFVGEAVIEIGWETNYHRDRGHVTRYYWRVDKHCRYYGSGYVDTWTEAIAAAEAALKGEGDE